MQDVLIIGSGPAGYAAALYTSRAFLKTLIIDGNQPGGQLTITTHVENYPGFPEGIMGPKLMEQMRKQVERFEAKSIAGSVTKADFSKHPFTVWVGETTHQAKSVILCVGASAKKLGIPTEERLWGKGVSACATCDGFFFRGKEIVVVGGGDTAMEEALFLTTYASKVTLVHRRGEFRASPIMLERAKKNPKIALLTNKTPTEILGDSSVTGVRLTDSVTGQVSTFPTQGVFVAIGYTPNTEFLKGIVDMDDKGYIKIHEHRTPSDPHTRTNIDGVFAAGDCTDPRYRQAVVAAGMGVMAALDVRSWLEEHA